MSPELDQMLVLGAIGAAVGFFAVRFRRKFTRKDGCAGDCCAPGKSKSKKPKLG